MALLVLLLSRTAAKPEASVMSSILNPTPRTIIRMGIAAEVRLQQLGIPDGSNPVTAALSDGGAGARATTRYHPRSYGGQRMWGETVASLRIYLEAHGWETDFFLGVDITLNRRLGLALIVTAGSAAVGDPANQPQVRYERKDVIRGLVNGSVDTLWSAQERPEWEPWFVLHHLTGNELRAEVARPTGIDRGGWVGSWTERIILPSTAFGTPGGGGRPIAAPPEVDIDVQRRVG